MRFQSKFDLVREQPSRWCESPRWIASRGVISETQMMFQYTVVILENLSQRGSYRDLTLQLNGIWSELPEAYQAFPFLAWMKAACDWRAAALHGKSVRAFFLKLKI